MSDPFVPVALDCRRMGGKTCARWWKARNSTGAQCLHLHATEAAAKRCADVLNRPTVVEQRTPQAAYDRACGYFN